LGQEKMDVEVVIKHFQFQNQNKIKI